MKTRSINNLLIIVRNHIQNQESLNSGICLEIDDLYSNGVITWDECTKLSGFMSKNRPMRGKHYVKNRQRSCWWWPRGEKEPRLAWLISKIKSK
jgi:hypothetical protein